jgi:hypothetical protein
MKKYFHVLIIFKLFISLLCKNHKKFKNNKHRNNEISKFLKSSLFPKSVVIFEYNPFHLECLPGYTKYFTDLGYKVDIIIRYNYLNSMEKFEPKSDVRIFQYHPNQIKKRKFHLKKKFRLYNYSLLLSTDKCQKKNKLYRSLGFFSNPKSLFIVHGYDFINHLNLKKFISKKHVFSLADYGKLIYVNPNYFGKFYLNFQKNSKVRFYITSTKNKFYSYLLIGARNLKNKLIDFQIHVTGHSKQLSQDIIPKDLKKYFYFHGIVSYRKLYKIIGESDFIILNLFNNNKIDFLFRTDRASGSVQLAYGFYKPVLVEEIFAPVYKFSNKTAIIFKNSDLSSAMENAAKISSKDYMEISKNIKSLRESIYNISLNNLKKVLK